MTPDEGGLSNVAPDGTARMVDVGAKPDTSRMARATGSIRMSPKALDAIVQNQVAKGDVLGVAGKGHEQGQLVSGVTHPFDDVAVTAAALQAEAAHA